MTPEQQAAILLDAMRKIIAEPLKADLSDGAILANIVEIATAAERRVTQ